MTAPALSGLSVPRSSLADRLRHEQQSLRTRAVASAVLAGLAVALFVLGMAAFGLADGRWMVAPRFVPLLAMALAIGTAVVVYVRRQQAVAAQLSVRSLAGTVEQEQQLRAGSLMGALEVSHTGVLGARAADDVARRLNPGTLAPQFAAALTRMLGASVGAAVLGVAVLGASAKVAPDGFAAATNPIGAWRGSLLPALAFERIPASVPRGMPLTLSVHAEGRRHITISRRAEGEVWHDSTLSVPSSGRVAYALGPMRSATTIRVNDGRAPELSATLAVEDRGWLGDVALHAMYPSYLGRADETLEPVPPLRVPRGTRIKVQVMQRGGAREAALTNGRDTVRLTALAANGDGTPAEGVVTIDREETWRWIAEATPRADGQVLPPELPDALPFTVIPDMPPEVAIVSPESDTAIGTSGVVPILVNAADDHGVGHVQLQLWREAAGGAGTVVRERLEVASPAAPIFEGGATIPLDGRKLEPGDKLHVVAIATDDSPWRQQVTSSEIILRVPSLAEQRSLARGLADSLAAQAKRLAQQEQRLAQNTGDAARNRELKNGDQSDGGKSDSKSMSFQQAEKAKQMARDQQQMSARVDSLRQNAKELENRLKNANALDTTLAGRMRDIQKMLREAMTPEMQKQLEQLNKNTDRLSGTEAQQSMQQLAEQQKRMREQLEKSAEMLKRAALEGAMQTLKDDASELAERQQNLSKQLGGQKPSGQQQGQQQAGQQSGQAGQKNGQKGEASEEEIGRAHF